ncbi:MAG: glycine cleavage system protein H [delta proteobacterium ML8_F1]|nr:MAG: glycine cleavage system protein H [delta proteobacterium ML8_F1]
MKVLEGLLYSEDHEWVKVEGNVATIGISDFAQHQLGDIVFVELPEVDAEIEKGDVFGVIESVKAASDSFLPVGGKVIEVNEALEDEPELINQDAYENWIVKVELMDESDLDGLMSPAEYEEFCNKEE